MTDNTQEKINIRGVFFDNLDFEGTAAKAVELINDKEVRVVYTPNSEIVQMCIEDDELKKLINSADMVIPDGAGVVLASKILHRPLKQKVAGIELAEWIVSYAAESGTKIFFLGSKPASAQSPSVGELAAARLAEKYPGFKVCGCRDGYFKDEDSKEVIDEINSLSPDVVFVCLGAPRQEKWISEHKGDINKGLLIGLGGSLDVFAGTVKRAPNFFVKTKLEWFYRLLKQPSRIGRMMKLPKFIFGTAFSKKD